MQKIMSLCLLCLAVGCAQIGKVGGIITGTTPEVSRSGDDGRTCRVFNDTGGNPFEYADFRSELDRSCDVVELGECNSACTMLMTLPNACLIPRKRFGFHSSNLGGLFNDELRKYYRAGVLEEFNSNWSNSGTIQRITSEEAVALDPQLKLCEV